MEIAKLSRIAPEIPVSDLEEAVEFYQQTLGFRVAMQMPDLGYAIVERDDTAPRLRQSFDPTRVDPVHATVGGKAMNEQNRLAQIASLSRNVDKGDVDAVRREMLKFGRVHQSSFRDCPPRQRANCSPNLGLDRPRAADGKRLALVPDGT